MCGPNSDCENSIGSFNCVCDAGYKRPDADADCADVNECEGELNFCDLNAECSNTPGDYECTCAEGFEGDGFECVESKLFLFYPTCRRVKY
mgnify:FL=1